jgi:hypothetical protein
MAYGVKDESSKPQAFNFRLQWRTKKAQPGHRQSWAFAFELISSGD